MTFFKLLSKIRSFATPPSSLYNSVRRLHSDSSSDLHSQLKKLIPEQQERLKKIQSDFGNVQLGNITANMVIGGMRGMPALLCETSSIDPSEGVCFRGLPLQECLGKLSAAVQPGGAPLPESLLWLLLTGAVPSHNQVTALSKELRSRAVISENTKNVYKAAIDAMPVVMDPVTQLTAGVLALQSKSVSQKQKAFEKGPLRKEEYWELVYEDSLNLIARLPVLAAYVYRRLYNEGIIIPADVSLDYGANFSHMLGFDDPKMLELMRLFLTIHSDHGGGNVSAHTARIVSSAHSDPYLSIVAALSGIAGPLHGLASQEVVVWIKYLVGVCGYHPSKDQLKDYVQKTLDSGKVIPGFGHEVLRTTDPRYTCQREFALKHLPKDLLFNLTSELFEVVPLILLERGEVNCWPSNDALSGVLLTHFGLTKTSFYRVLFGVARSIGICSQLIWDRALGLPMERPNSVTMEWLEKHELT